MKAMVLERTGLLRDRGRPLRLVDLPTPSPSPRELLIRVTVCGVCHTELDEIEGRLTPPTLPIIPGHEVIGRVVSRGTHANRFQVGDRVGVGWIHSSDGGEQENLSPAFKATGCDVNGGYAEFMTVSERYATPIPTELPDAEAAPLMCAGAIGFRALRIASIQNGQRLGLMGFGGSAHLVLQLANYVYPDSPVYVFDRAREVQQFALELGADWSGDLDQSPPEPVHAMIDTTPAWKPVVESMKKLMPAGRLVINAIRKEEADKDALLTMSYHDHLWMEREIKSVANLTRFDIRDFLPLAAEILLRPRVVLYPLEDANEALQDLRKGGLRGASVLQIA
ncbi:MAG: zinc-dependent alcohol dehydrogenase family protein [Rubripirellula sp.]